MEFKFCKVIVVTACLVLNLVNGQKAAPAAAKEEEGKPMAYNFVWKVSAKDAKPDGAFFQHTEKAEESNPERVEGEFRTWLPDGRLKIVTYYVDKDSGFVPTITYEKDHKPAFRRR